MRRVILSIVFALMGVSFTNAASDPKLCASIGDNLRRLDCYDQMFRTGDTDKIQSKKDDPVSFVDFLTDFEIYRGKRLTVSGFGLMLGDNLVVYKEMGSMNAFFVDISRLSRENKRELYGRCGSGCSVVVSGIAEKIMMQKGMAAQYVTLVN